MTRKKDKSWKTHDFLSESIKNYAQFYSLGASGSILFRDFKDFRDLKDLRDLRDFRDFRDLRDLKDSSSINLCAYRGESW